MSKKGIRVRRSMSMAVACGLGMTLAFGCAAPASPAFAVPAASTSSITLNKAGDGTYKVYQLFTGSFVQEGSQWHMTDAIANAGHKQAIVEAIKVYDPAFKFDESAPDHTQANALTDAIVKIDKDGNAQKFANTLAEKLGSSAADRTATATNGTLSITGISDGYYLVVSDAASKPGAAATSAVLVPVHGATTGNAKISVPTVDKTVKDDGGSALDQEFGESADAGLVADQMSKLTFRLEGTVPGNIAEFTSGASGSHNYYYAFVDTLPKGFDVASEELAGWGVQIMCGAHDVTADFTPTVTTDPATHTSTIRWETTDLKGVLENAGIAEPDMASQRIVVTYAPVYDTQDIERLVAYHETLDPQTNTAKIEFSNSPYAEGHGESVPDEAKTYDYSLQIAKIDDKQQALAGAEFTLKVAGGKDAGKVVAVATGETGIFKFAGLESDVEYTLTETKVPAGMKSIDPITFRIQATKDQAGQVTGVSYVEVKDPSNAATWAQTGAASAFIKLNITNVPGPDLPLTGRAGIIGGVVMGGIVLTVSAAALVRNRRDRA